MSKDYLLIESSDTRLHSGDVVTISTYGDTKWIVKHGWYKLNTAQKNGWYFLSVADNTLLPADMVDLDQIAVSNNIASGDNSHPTLATTNKSIIKSGTSNDECKYVVIPGTTIRLYDGDIVKISTYPRSKWIIHSGWYIDGTKQNYGWYLSNIKSGKILPVNTIDLTTCTLISSYVQGSKFTSGPELNYTRPFTDSDAEMLSRTFISLDTIEQRDSLDVRKLINGKLVRVNDVDGEVAYFAWNALTKQWDDAQLSGNIQRVVGTSDSPIILSELPPNVYLVYGQYKISPNDPTTYITLSDILTLVNNDGDQVYIKVIDNQSLTDYIVEDDDISLKSEYLTDASIMDKYATIEYVDNKFRILEIQIQELIETLDSRIREIAREEDRLYSTDIAQEYIDNLFE